MRPLCDRRATAVRSRPHTMSLMTRHRFVLRLLGAVAVMGTLVSTGASSAAAGPRVTFQGTFQPANLMTPACDSAGRCVYPLARTGSAYTGAFTGSSVGAGSGTPVGTGFVGSAVHVFTGNVKGCGDGTLVWTETLRSADGVASTGTWRVTAGSGTGDLAHLVGGGTFRAIQNPDGSGSVKAIGRIRC